MSSAVNNAFYYTLGAVLKAITSFLLLPVFANALGAAQYGSLSLLQSFSSILAIFLTLATERSLYRLYYDYKDDEGRTRFLSTIFWTINLLSIFVFAITIPFRGPLASLLGETDLSSALLPVVIYTYLMALINFCQIVLQVEQKGLNFFKISMLLMLAYNVVALLFLFFYKKTYYSLVLGNLVANAIVLPVALFFVKGKIKLVFDGAILKKTFLFSYPLFLMTVFSWVLHMSDRMFISHFSTMENLGLYSMASKIVSIMLLLDGAIFQAYGPFFFSIANNKEESEAKYQLKKVNDVVTLIVCGVGIGIVLFSNLVVHLVLKPEFHECLKYIYFLTVAAIISQQVSILNPMIYQNKKTKGISRITIIAAFVNFGMNWLLMPRYGAIIAAFSNLFTSGLIFFLTLWLASREYYIPLNGRLIVSAIVLALMMFVADYLFDSIWVALAVKIVLLFLFAWTLVRCKTINIEEVKLLSRKFVLKRAK